MRIAIHTIALNEQNFVQRWADTTTDADDRLVVDTGSTDATMAKLAEHGVPCQSIRIKPFRFDDARNAALAMLPACDVVVSLDMDEVLVAHWRQHIEHNWHGTRLRYGYVWSWTAAGQPDVTFEADKIVGRHSHRWRHPVHELLVPTVPEVISVCDTVLIEHRADPHKPRRHYLDLLRLAVQETPLDSRMAHYLGRECYFHNRYDEAIVELHRHLALPCEWPQERASSMRYMAKCHQAKDDHATAYRWFVRATLEDNSSREPLIDAACCCLAQNAFHATIDFAQRALALPPTKTYMAERYASQEGPYDLAARAHYHLGNRLKAVTLATKALAFNPHDSRLQDNLRMVGGTC